MIPASFTFLEQLPLSPNGKLDRKALPEPLKAQPRDDYVAPKTALEQTIVETWASVLHEERIGLRSDFFQLGGHSLLAAHVIALLSSVSVSTCLCPQSSSIPSSEISPPISRR